MFGLGVNRLGATNQKPFSPASLFNNGEAGVWYDPSAASGSLDWRKNLLEYTESFDNSYWNKANATVTANFTTAPDGTQTADKIQFTVTAYASVFATKSVVSGSSYTLSVFAKAGNISTLSLEMRGSSSAPDTVFNLSSGTITSGTGTIEDYGDGWYRCTLTQAAIDNSELFIIGANSAAGNIYLWGAQLEEASTASSYQPILSTFANAFKAAFPSHTLYQDSQSVTPVTAVGQPVGLMLDKSEGLAQGPELVTNGDFATDSGWSNQAGWTIGGGVASVNSSVAGSTYIRQGSTVIGRMYQITFEVTSFTSGALYATAGSAASGGPITSTGVYTRLALANTTQGFGVYASGSTTIASIDNISVKEVAGSHATQPTSTKRPIYARHPEGGIRNLLNYTEQFDNGAWIKGSGGTLTPNYAASPIGTQTADRLVLPATSATYIAQTVQLESGKAYTFSAYVKATAGNSSFDMYVAGGVSYLGNSTATSEWQRFSFTTTAASSSTVDFGINNFDDSYASDILIWGAQVEEATEASNYQKVVTDIDVTESGVGEVYYLKFDGVDDSMSINNLTSSSTPLTALFGYSATNTTSTSKYLFDIQNGRTVFGISDGYIRYYDGAWSEFPADAEAIKVLTYDLVEDNAKIRIDGTQEYSDTTYDQKAIGGTIKLFTAIDSDARCVAGNMYQTILRAAESTDEEIAKAETYVANKTGLKAQVDGIATLDLNFGNNTYTAKNSNGGVI